MSVSSDAPAFAAADSIAASFVRARLDARPLAAFPGPIPPDRESAYACQDAAITLWPDTLAGWKIGRPAPDREAAFGAARIAGPIFRRAVRLAEGVVSAPFIEGGFAAIEGEFIFRLGRDAPPDKQRWTEADAAALVETMHIGVETAGSPLALINSQGPTVTVADFGNNAGLILGSIVPDWRDRALEDLVCEAFIDGRSVGRADATAIPGGPLGGLCFLLGHCAAHGRPLTAGQLVSTGAVTGVHEIEIGQTARVEFGALGMIECLAVRAEPQTRAKAAMERTR